MARTFKPGDHVYWQRGHERLWCQVGPVYGNRSYCHLETVGSRRTFYYVPFAELVGAPAPRSAGG